MTTQSDRPDSGAKEEERGGADHGRAEGASHLRHGARRHREDQDLGQASPDERAGRRGRRDHAADRRHQRPHRGHTGAVQDGQRGESLSSAEHIGGNSPNLVNVIPSENRFFFTISVSI